MTRKPRASMPNHTSKQCISIKGQSGDPKSARKRVANPTEHRDDHACTINPAGVPAAEITRDAPITTRGTRISNPSRPAGPTRGRLQWLKKDNETRHKRGCQTSQCHQAKDHPRRCRVSQGRPGTYPQPKNRRYAPDQNHLR